MVETWVKIYRKSIENGWLTNRKLWTFWCYCLLKASHKEHNMIVGSQQIKLMPGQFVFGRKKAAKALKMSERSIRTCLDNLKKMQNVTTKTTNKFSIVTISKWESYQSQETKATTKTTKDRPATDQQPATNKNERKEEGKNEYKKKEYSQSINDLVDVFYSTFEEEEAKKIHQFRDNYLDTCDKLIRIDGYTEDQIGTAIISARNDDFWADNFLSFDKLRKTSKTMGVKFIDRFLKIKKPKRKQGRIDGNYDGMEEAFK